MRFALAPSHTHSYDLGSWTGESGTSHHTRHTSRNLLFRPLTNFSTVMPCLIPRLVGEFFTCCIEMLCGGASWSQSFLLVWPSGRCGLSPSKWTYISWSSSPLKFIHFAHPCLQITSVACYVVHHDEHEAFQNQYGSHCKYEFVFWWHPGVRSCTLQCHLWWLMSLSLIIVHVQYIQSCAILVCIATPSPSCCWSHWCWEVQSLAVSTGRA